MLASMEEQDGGWSLGDSSLAMYEPIRFKLSSVFVASQTSDTESNRISSMLHVTSGKISGPSVEIPAIRQCLAYS